MTSKRAAAQAAVQGPRRHIRLAAELGKQYAIVSYMAVVLRHKEVMGSTCGMALCQGRSHCREELRC